MKWDVKHDRAKKVIDRFLDNAGYWQESEDLVTGLTDEEKELVNAEVELMIASIRKEEIDLRKVVKRMRGARPWHPLLQALRKELEG